jgi:hypothetical protein
VEFKLEITNDEKKKYKAKNVILKKKQKQNTSNFNKTNNKNYYNDRNYNRPSLPSNGGLIRRKRRIRNTIDFKPNYEAPNMRVLVGDFREKFTQPISNLDVVLISNFCDKNDYTLYNKLLKEIKDSGINDVFIRWHKSEVVKEGTHLIANDRVKWKQHCKTFNKIVKQIENYFGVISKATRLNWYKDTKEWKPFHRDAAALKPEQAVTQNITIGLSLGRAMRSITFEHIKTGTKTNFPLINGSIYAFSRDINIYYRHGIPAIKEFKDEGRISCNMWCYSPNMIEIK